MYDFWKKKKNMNNLEELRLDWAAADAGRWFLGVLACSCILRFRFPAYLCVFSRVECSAWTREEACALSWSIKRGRIPLQPSPFALIITVAGPLCCFAHLIRTEQHISATPSYPKGPFTLTLARPPQSSSPMSKTSTEAPPNAGIRTAVSQAIQTASSISQRELSRRRTCECKCDRLTGHDWQVKPLVNCLLLPHADAESAGL